MRLLPCGRHGLLVEVARLDDVLDLYAALLEQTPPGVVDMVPAARTVMLHVDPAVTNLAKVERAVRAIKPSRAARADEPLVEIPVVYDGEDLADVGALTGWGVEGVIERHTSAPWTVAFCGFAPGFAYLASSEHGWSIPRRMSPRVRVPAGAVALGDEFTGVYPRESPGGWQLIGHAQVPKFDLDRDPPALLMPGCRVHFVDVGRG